ncbi:MAG TPA: helix-turn-helix domain-containing protein [Actinophytocola sp.]|nr:helix-turn-helix domain-containing protein [Actinophytocola sp.]
MTAKVCAIVLAVSNTPEQFISEVARRTGLPASTAHRLLCELVKGGLLERNTAGRFTVCVELHLLHGPGKRAAHARSLVGTVLEDLAAATGLRARFAVWHPTGISYLEQAPGTLPGSCVSGPQSVCQDRFTRCLSASFHIAENGADHQFTMPAAPPQESVPLWQDRLREFGDQVPARWLRPRPVEIRYIGDPPWATRGSASPPEATTMVWMRSVRTLPDDPLLHVCVAAYASDMTLLDSVLLAQRLAWAENTATGASLDQAMWFHAPFQAYDWLLHVQEAPATSGARARTHLSPRRAPRGIRRARRANPRPPITPTLSNHGEPRIRHRKPHNT